MASNKQTRRVIVRLLSNLGAAKEVQQYLKRYSDLDDFKFAVVKIGGATIRDRLPELASSLTFLESVGLAPIVIHGGGPQLNDALAEAGVHCEVRDGLRVTSPAALKVARRVFRSINLRLTQALRDAGSHATSITGGVFEAQIMDRERYGMVGEVTSVDIEPIRAVTGAGHIPVISPLAETADGQILNINGDVAANALVGAVQPYKIIFLSSIGGILDAHDQIISSINLSTDYQQLMQSDWLHSGMRLKLEQIKRMLEGLPRECSVSITRPSLLAKELFTHRGSGTLVRRGELIRTYDSWESIDTPRLRRLLESSFGKSLADDYFATTPLAAAHVSDSYRAGAVVSAGADGVALLDKFAVTEEAQGEGIGRALWKTLRTAHPALCWRARPDNPVVAFYSQQADGFVRTPDWLVFWYGIPRLADVEALVPQVSGKRETMLEQCEA